VRRSTSARVMTHVAGQASVRSAPKVDLSRNQLVALPADFGSLTHIVRCVCWMWSRHVAMLRVDVVQAGSVGECSAGSAGHVWVSHQSGSLGSVPEPVSVQSDCGVTEQLMRFWPAGAD
jgi:hypothetical protein